MALSAKSGSPKFLFASPPKVIAWSANDTVKEAVPLLAA